MSAESSSDSAARVELEKAKRTLSKYERVFGPNSESSDDITQLAQRLESTEKEKSILALELDQSKSVSYRTDRCIQIIKLINLVHDINLFRA